MTRILQVRIHSFYSGPQKLRREAVGLGLEVDQQVLFEALRVSASKFDAESDSCSAVGVDHYHVFNLRLCRQGVQQMELSVFWAQVSISLAHVEFCVGIEPAALGSSGF